MVFKMDQESSIILMEKESKEFGFKANLTRALKSWKNNI